MRVCIHVTTSAALLLLVAQYTVEDREDRWAMRSFGPLLFVSLPSVAVLAYSTSPSSSSSSSSASSSSSSLVGNAEVITDRLIFLGTGSSSGLPHPYHLMNPEQASSEMEKNQVQVSLKGAEGDPRYNKNYRCNPSLLVQCREQKKNIIIDTGKTFRESILRWFPKYEVSSVDAIILTHGHADAIFGLDDVRSVQSKTPEPMSVHLSKECFKVVSYTFPYLVPPPPVSMDDGKNSNGNGNRHVAKINFNMFNWFSSFKAADCLEVEALPVKHGEDLDSSAFIFGKKDRIVYISDVSRIIPETLSIVNSEPVTVLVLDALCLTFKHPTHYSLEQAIEFCRKVRPKRALFVGMSSQFDHDEVNEFLATFKEKEGLCMELAHDGLCLEVKL